MPSLWKKLLILAAGLLVISLALIGGLWYQLEGIKSQLNIARTPLVATETGAFITGTRSDMTAGEQNPMLARYSDWRNQINMRLGSGQDSQSFIIPNDPAVSALVQEITGGYSQDAYEYWRDFERMYHWVIENIEYTKDTYTPVIPQATGGTLVWVRDFWRMPAETLKDRAGDCEDMATLLASMMLNYTDGKFAVWGVGINIVSPEYKGHIAVAVPVKGNKLAILDPAENYFTGYHSGWGLTYHDVAVATNDWLAHLEKNMPDAQIYMVFYDTFYREFSGNQEFIDWVREW